MTTNLYSFILLSGSVIAAGIFMLLHKRRSRSLSNPDYVAPIILEAIDEAIIVTNNLKTITFVNQSGESLLKTSRKEIVGKNISEIFTDNQTQLTPELNEANIKTPGGEIIPVSISVNKIMYKNKKFLGYNITMEKNETVKKNPAQLQEKINELDNINNLLKEMEQSKKKGEQNIRQKVQEITLDSREENTRLYASINNLSLGFIMSDKEQNIILINNTAKNLFSIPDSDTNINLQDLQMHTQGKINFLEGTKSVLKNDIPLSFENVRIDNKFANIFISPINSLSETTGAVFLTEDKTEERIAEKSKEDFFTIASHELRAPLTAIRGYIALIKQLFFINIKDEELKKIIQDIDTLSSQLINIVNDFLDTPKLEQGKIRVKKEPQDLIEIIKAGIKETTPIATQKNLVINFTNPLDSAMVLGDKERIRQVLINLISNGLKYTEEGGITINIEKTLDSKYKISVKDTGKGVPKENIKILFTKFQQTDPTKHMTSTGLGLYISKLLVEKMNGVIKLENTEEGKGSTFSFSLPVYEQTVASTQTTGVN